MNETYIDSMRLRLEPMDAGALAALRDTTADETLRQTYTQLLEEARKDPENRQWYTCWSIIEKKAETRVGDIWFRGAPKEHTVSVCCGVDAPHRGNMYAAEALASLSAWALNQKGVYFVEGETEADNGAAVWSLEHAEFRRISASEGVELWRRERAKSQWLYVCTGFGMALGGLIGAALGNLSEGLVTGLCIGLLPGTVLYCIDRGVRRKRGFRQKGGLLKI